MDITKKEIQRLCDLGVLQWQADLEWALPTFIIPKKDNTVRVVSDFRELDKSRGVHPRNGHFYMMTYG